MRVSVIGAGAIGGWLAAACVKAGADVAVLARSASLEALQRDGLWLEDDEGQSRYDVHATHEPADLKGADVLLLGVKAHDLPAMAQVIEAALDANTVVVPAINGLPWWFFDRFGGPAQGMRIDAVDPGGVLSRLMPGDQVVGAVVHAASYVAAPGRIRLMSANKLWLGNAGGANHADDVAQMFVAGGVPAEVSDTLHWHVWNKLWGNSNMNPLSALSRGNLVQMLEDRHIRSLVIAMMREMAELGVLIGLDGFDAYEKRLETTLALGPFKTSMLQDVEAGRALEIEPILGGLVELAERLNHPTPAMNGVYGLTRLLDHTLRSDL